MVQTLLKQGHFNISLFILGSFVHIQNPGKIEKKIISAS